MSSSTVERPSAKEVYAKPAQDSGARRSLARTVLASTFIWIFVVLFGIDFLLTSVRPLRFVRIEGLLLKDQDMIGEKVVALKAVNDGSNVILLGTSLLGEAAGLADLQNGQQMSTYWKERYTGAKTFDACIKKNIGLDTQSLSVHVGGGLFYDSWLLLEMALKEGRRPAMIVFSIAPRDFIDTRKQSKDCAVKIFQDSRLENIPNVKNLQIAVDIALSKLWNFYRVKSDYHTVAQLVSCAALRRAPTVFDAAQQADGEFYKTPRIVFSTEDPVYSPSAHLPADKLAVVTKMYAESYSRVDKAKLDEQMGYFARALKLCREKNIPAVVVAMPLTRDNRNLLPLGFETEYLNRLAAISKQQDAKFMDLMRDDRFVSDEFSDRVHLNGPGGAKFWDLLTRSMNDDKTFVATLRETLKANHDLR